MYCRGEARIDGRDIDACAFLLLFFAQGEPIFASDETTQSDESTGRQDGE
jgi:hypothetical protein